MFGVLTDWLMPYHPFTMLLIFNIFWSIEKSPSVIWQHWPNLLPTGSLCSLTVQTNWYCSFRRMSINSCDIVRYTDQCWIWLKGQSEFSTIGDLLMLPRAFKNLGLPSFNSVAFPSLSLQWNRVFELDIVYHTWTRWKKACSNIARALATLCLQMPGWRFAAVNFGAGYLSSSHFFSFS